MNRRNNQRAFCNVQDHMALPGNSREYPGFGGKEPENQAMRASSHQCLENGPRKIKWHRS